MREMMSEMEVGWGRGEGKGGHTGDEVVPYELPPEVERARQREEGAAMGVRQAEPEQGGRRTYRRSARVRMLVGSTVWWTL